ncbi:MAG: hypothetical protein HY540_01785 [Deltaproteobacteria bacterium]|nr:hypothetical protein [Deltaproteobacteria bacterium]
MVTVVTMPLAIQGSLPDLKLSQRLLVTSLQPVVADVSVWAVQQGAAHGQGSSTFLETIPFTMGDFLSHKITFPWRSVHWSQISLRWNETYSLSSRQITAIVDCNITKERLKHEDAAYFEDQYIQKMSFFFRSQRSRTTVVNDLFLLAKHYGQSQPLAVFWKTFIEISLEQNPEKLITALELALLVRQHPQASGDRTFTTFTSDGIIMKWLLTVRHSYLPTWKKQPLQVRNAFLPDFRALSPYKHLLTPSEKREWDAITHFFS